MTGVPFSGYRLDVAAVVESDATITKAPKKKVLTGGNKAKVKIKFTTTDPGGTVACTVDGKAFKACKSPFNKRYEPGKHKVVIKAINAQGVEDIAPSVVKFKVKQRP